MSFQCLHVCFGFLHGQKGKSLLKFSGQHNSEQNKETGDWKERLPRWKITWPIKKQRGELTLLIISRANLEEYRVSAARNHKNFVRRNWL